MPAARATDMAVCVGPPDLIAKGSATVLIMKMPAARIETSYYTGAVLRGLCLVGALLVTTTAARTPRCPMVMV